MFMVRASNKRDLLPISQRKAGPGNCCRFSTKPSAPKAGMKMERPEAQASQYEGSHEPTRHTPTAEMIARVAMTVRGRQPEEEREEEL